jgi:hypothetical protein
MDSMSGFAGGDWEDKAPHADGSGSGSGGDSSDGRLIDINLSIKEAEAIVAHLSGERPLTVAESLSVAGVVARLQRQVGE